MQTLKDINLSKLKKCDQIWENMPPTEQGRICQKCKNTIIDFRDIPRNEIAEIHTFTEGQVCGLYSKNQLNLGNYGMSRSGNLRRMALGIIGLATSLNITAQVHHDSTQIIQTEPQYNKDSKDEDKVNKIDADTSSNESTFIRGKLMDESGEVIIFANVHIKGTKFGTTSDFDGNYVLNITELIDTTKEIILIYSYIGFQVEEVVLNREQLKDHPDNNIDVVFKEAFGLDFYVIEKQPFHKRVWNSMKNLFKRKNRTDA